MVLDVMLGESSGFDLCRDLRAAGNDAPVIFLTARDAPGDRIAGFVAEAHGGMARILNGEATRGLVIQVRLPVRNLA